MGAVQDSYITVAWLVLLVALLVIEIITVGLTTIWGAGGALAALILNILDIPFAGQVVAFFVFAALGIWVFMSLYFTIGSGFKLLESRHNSFCNAFYQHPPSKDEL